MIRYAAALPLVCALGLLVAAPVPAAAKTFVFCSEGNPEAMNPQLAITGTAMDATRPMFDTLVEFEPGTTQLRPALAESWTVSADGREIVFHLRPGVAFHDSDIFQPTRTLEAADVVFSIERQWRSDHPFHAVSTPRFDYFQDAGMPELLESVEAVDPLTVRIRLRDANAPFLANFTMPFLSILSAEYADTLQRRGTPAEIDTKPIGTGPFRFVDFRPDVLVRYRVFDRSWRGPQAIDTLVFSITPTASARLAKLASGECHASAYPDAEDMRAIRANPELKLYESPAYNVGYMAINTSRPPFNDRRVRQALNYAIDKRAIIDAVYGAGGVEAVNPLPPANWAYDETAKGYPYDPERARQLLREAGLEKGFDVDLWYTPVSRPYNPNGIRVYDMISADLEKLGIRTYPRTAEWNSYRSVMQDGNVPLALYGWTGDNGDPDNFMTTLLSCDTARIGGNNIARWCDKRFDDLVRRARTGADPEIRRELYVEAERIFRDEAPWVPIAHSVFAVGARREVRNFVMDPLGYHNFTGVDLAGSTDAAAGRNRTAP
ncbi:ABC transporter substrate-binding protein [Aureimonas jatrophae]|uniref:Dipeptide transport system substrate-binding protein n=1 Tax=Aureimonas jatrophae TaxID=1166073 RepID=A0A1H0DB48_9HYPH|nr:ABC transporter substrate-binding protein [Aureimonas jatrophae]MBB3951799.1 dipeptide transport system substrate-binding protein [Aureimonas jatrophae]SDN67457.1 dipeptide transport system substrate-binding protein [Aureimonas jatrophae]